MRNAGIFALITGLTRRADIQNNKGPSVAAHFHTIIVINCDDKRPKLTGISEGTIRKQLMGTSTTSASNSQSLLRVGVWGSLSRRSEMPLHPNQFLN